MGSNRVRLLVYLSVVLVVLVLKSSWRHQPTPKADLSPLTTENSQELKALQLKRELIELEVNATTSGGVREKADFFQRLQKLCASIDELDWTAFQVRYEALRKKQLKLDRKSRDFTSVSSALVRRRYVATLQRDARMCYAKKLCEGGRNSECRLNLRKLLRCCPTLAPTWEFVHIAHQVYDPSDKQFADEFGAALDKYAGCRQEDSRVLRFWMNQVLTQPKDGTFHYYRTDEALALIDDLDPRPPSPPCQDESKEHNTSIRGKGVLTVKGTGTVTIDGGAPVAIDADLMDKQVFEVRAVAQIKLVCRCVMAAAREISFSVETGVGVLEFDGGKTVSVKKGGSAICLADKLYLCGPLSSDSDRPMPDLATLGRVDPGSTGGAQFSASGWDRVEVDGRDVALLENCRRVYTSGHCRVRAVCCQKVIAAEDSHVRVENCNQTWAWDRSTVEKIGAGIVHGSRYAKTS